MAARQKVILIGGGIGGLAAAYSLRARGYDVEVYETGEEVGGRNRALQYRGDVVDVGTQFYHQDYHSAFRLAAENGLGSSIRPARGTGRYALKNGTIYTHNPTNPFFAPLGLSGHLDLLAFYVRYVLFGKDIPPYHICKAIPEYDNVGILDLYGGKRHERFRTYVVEPISYLGNMGTPQWLNLYHFLHQFKLGTFANYSVCDAGMPSLPRALAAQLKVRLGTPVQRVVVEGGRTVGVQLANGTVQAADHVIVAVTPPAAAAILAEQLDEQAAFFRGIVYSPVAMPVFFLDRALGDDVLFYMNDPALGRTFMCAIDHRVKAPALIRSNKSVLTCWAGHPKTLELAAMTDDQVLAVALQDLELMLPKAASWVEHASVVRHPYGVERYPVGSYGRIMTFAAQAEMLPGISFVGSLFGGSSMEAAILSAERAVDRICSSHVRH